MDTSTNAGPHLPSLRRLLGSALALLLLSFLVATSHTSMAAHNADSLIPVFVSLERWTPFYWGQDRFGMLLALIAVPVQDSFSNLVLQNSASVLLFLLGVFSVHHCLRCRAALPLTLLSLAFIIVTSPSVIFLMLFTTNQSYAPALGLCGIAVWCSTSADAAKRLLTGPLVILAAWTNVGVALFVLFYAAALMFKPWSRCSARLMAAWSATGIGIHLWMQAFVSTQTTVIGRPLWSDAPLLLSRFFMDLYHMGGGVFWTILLASWLVAWWSATKRPAVWPAARDGLTSALIAGIIYGVAMALLASGLPRHMMAAVPVLYVVPFVVMAKSLPQVPSAAKLFAGPAILLLALFVGVQSPREARRELTDVLGQGLQGNLYGQRVVAVTGDYWSVWHAVFATNLVHEQFGGSRPVLPIAQRGEILRDRWRVALLPGAPIAVIPPEDRLYWATQPDLPPLENIETHAAWTLALTAAFRK
jgi:hypothetical protein